MEKRMKAKIKYRPCGGFTAKFKGPRMSEMALVYLSLWQLINVLF